MTTAHTLKRSVMLASLAMLAACQAPQKAAPGAAAQSQMDKLLSRAAQNAETSGNTEKSLALLGQVYRRNSDKPEAALSYAEALRKSGQAGKAASVLEGFVGQNDTLDDIWRIRLHSEMAMAHLSQGNFATGQEHAQRAVDTGKDHDDREVTSAAAKAYHILGIAMDAQGKHEGAEKAFRKGLENWEGDPVPIMNNLALNLANQGHLDEAVKIIDKARQTAPERTMVERNYRILTTMNEKVSYHIPAPPPAKKPDIASGQDPDKGTDTEQDSAKD